MNFKPLSVFVLTAATLGGFFLASCVCAQAEESAECRFQQDGKLRVEINGKLFTEYFYTNVPRPYFYPLLGPNELPMTRRWPLESSTDEQHDHPHHRSLWYAIPASMAWIFGPKAPTPARSSMKNSWPSVPAIKPNDRVD